MSVNLYIVCGAPGSGKSTFLSKNKANNEVIISRDEIRFAILDKKGGEYFDHEEEVYSTFVENIVKNLVNGTNVYADATHLNPISRAKLIRAIKRKTNLKINYFAIYFNVPLNVCLERNNFRKGTRAYVPVDALKNMYSTFESPIKEEGFISCWSIDKNNFIIKEW